MSFDEVSLQFSRPSELPDVYTPVSISLWNQADMQALSLSQRSTVPVAFGDLELIDSNVSNSGKSKISVENAIEPLQLAQEQSRLSERTYKQEVPPAADRELHALFPKLDSKHTRISHASSNIYDHLQEAHAHCRDFTLDRFTYLRGRVNTNAPWDSKSLYTNPKVHSELNKYHYHPTAAPLWVQNYGNFNYGATAFALGLSEDEALLFADAAQQGGTEKHPLKSAEGLLAGAKNTVKAAVLPNHGDSDENDQFRIRQGYRWAQKHATELGISD